MKVYSLTDLGKSVAKDKSDSSDDELRILKFIKDRKKVTDRELDTITETYVVKHLVRDGLVKELTS